MTKLTKFLFSDENITLLEMIGGYFFWIGFYFEIIYLVFRRCGMDLPLETYWLRGVALCFCIKILFTKYTCSEWVFIVGLCFTGIVGYFMSGMDVFFRTTVFVLSSKGINRRSAVKSLWITLIISAILYIVRGFWGIGGPIVDIRDYGRGAIETRYCLGFSHPNGLHYSMFAIMALGLWLYQRQFSWKWYLVLIGLNTILFYLTKSRTGSIVAYFMLISCLLFKYCNYLRECTWSYSIGYLLIAGVCMLSGIAVSIHAEWGLFPMLVKVNRMLTGRLGYAYESLHNQKISLFSMQGLDFSYVDMGLLNQIYTFGLLYSILFVMAEIGLLYKNGKEKQYVEYFLICSIIIYMGIESIQTSSLYPTQIFIWILLINQWNKLFRVSNKRTFYLLPVFKKIEA